jgi:hypothetical protein
MFNQQRFVVWLMFLIVAAAANADPVAYVIGAAGISNQEQFGTVDLATGAFQQIGPNMPFGSFGLASGPNGSLLTLAYCGDLYSINAATGVATFVGNTGLADCTTVGVSPCGPNSAFDLASLGGKVYATDFQNDLYAVDPISGKATFLGHTAIPAAPATLGSFNPDGTINFADEAVWGAGGKLYATFDALTFDLDTNQPVDLLVPPMLYEIDPGTGSTTIIGPTDPGIGGVVGESGAYYAFNDAFGQVCSLNLANGNTSQCTNFDPAAGVIQGAAPTPEPASLALAGIGVGIAALVIGRRRRSRLQR